MKYSLSRQSCKQMANSYIENLKKNVSTCMFARNWGNQGQVGCTLKYTYTIDK